MTHGDIPFLLDNFRRKNQMRSNVDTEVANKFLYIDVNSPIKINALHYIKPTVDTIIFRNQLLRALHKT